jgi:hypothetical protein
MAAESKAPVIETSEDDQQPNNFEWIYNFDSPGLRTWCRDQDGWTETYPGVTKKFAVEKRDQITVEDGSILNGTVVRLADAGDPNFFVFIPDMNSKYMWLYFRREKEDWNFMGVITKVQKFSPLVTVKDAIHQNNKISLLRTVSTRLLKDELITNPATVSNAPLLSNDELNAWGVELKKWGLTPLTLKELNQKLLAFNAYKITSDRVLDQIDNLMTHLRRVENDVETLNRRFDLLPNERAEQAYIDQQPKLLNYQRELQQELVKFILAYFLVSTGLFTLEANTKGKAIKAVDWLIDETAGKLPFAGGLLKIFTTKILEFANDQYRMYQINRLTKLFTGTEDIERAIVRFSRQLTLAKEAEVQAGRHVQPTGIAGRMRTFYHDVKESIDLALDHPGMSFTEQEKLALLDAAFLLEEVLSGAAKIEAGTSNLDVVPVFLRVMLKNPSYRYTTPSYVLAAFPASDPLLPLSYPPSPAPPLPPIPSSLQLPPLSGPPNSSASNAPALSAVTTAPRVSSSSSSASPANVAPLPSITSSRYSVLPAPAKSQPSPAPAPSLILHEDSTEPQRKTLRMLEEHAVRLSAIEEKLGVAIASENKSKHLGQNQESNNCCTIL